MAHGNLFKFFSTFKCSVRRKFVLALHVNSEHIKYFKSFWECISKLFDSYGQIWEGLIKTMQIISTGVAKLNQMRFILCLQTFGWNEHWHFKTSTESWNYFDFRFLVDDALGIPKDVEIWFCASLHYWLRWSIGFWNVQKVVKFRHLFLIQ